MRTTVRTTRLFWMVLGSLMVMLAGAAVASASSHQATDTLPGGTNISVGIDSPADSTTYLVPVGGTADVTVEGTASVGEGAVVKDTTVVYVVDNSGSTSLSAGVDCTGDAANDDVLTCEQEALEAANTAAADPGSAVDETGLVSFNSTATAHDVDLGAGGTQHIVAPDHDGDGNSTPDVEDVADSLLSVGGTNFGPPVAAADTVLASSTNPVNLVVFMTDGAGAAPTTQTLPSGTIVKAFAIGTASSCSAALNAVVALGEPGSDCTEVTDISTLADVIAEAVGSELTSLDISVDGGAATTIPNSEIDPDLPQPGPANVSYSTLVSGLAPGDHEICVTANGSDAGGSGSVTACVTVHVVVEVAADIQPTSCPNPFNVGRGGVVPAAVLGSSDFDVSDIDPSTVELEGVSASRSAIEDVAGPHTGGISDPPEREDCTTEGADGFDDLTLKFDARDVSDALEANFGPLSDGDVVVVTITGELQDGTPFQGQDVVWIIKK